jgi:hypothetical protein
VGGQFYRILSYAEPVAVVTVGAGITRTPGPEGSVRSSAVSPGLPLRSRLTDRIGPAPLTGDDRAG